MNRVCAAGFHEARETGGFRYGGPSETTFMISHEVDEECEPLMELYEDSNVAHHLPYSLADRDFVEKYGKMEPEKVVMNPELLSGATSHAKGICRRI